MNDSKIYYCYKVTNLVNGKVYIGFAADPQTRWRNHKRDADRGSGYAFHDAIRKYGWHSFVFEVICCGKNKHEMLTVIEPALMEQYDSYLGHQGYNMHFRVRGMFGRTDDRRTPEQQEKWSAAAKRRVDQPGARQRIANGLKRHFAKIEHPRNGKRYVEPKRKLPPVFDGNWPLKDYLLQHCLNSAGNWSQTLCREKPLRALNVWDEIQDRTKFLDSEVSIGERLYCIRHDLIAVPQCSMCPNPVRYAHCRRELGPGYLRTCSARCGRRQVLTKQAA